MKFSITRILLLLIFVSVNSSIFASGFRLNSENVATQDTFSYVSPFMEDNERCFKCHGQDRYEYTNENLGQAGKSDDV